MQMKCNDFNFKRLKAANEGKFWWKTANQNLSHNVRRRKMTEQNYKLMNLELDLQSEFKT